jgi:HK97 gp10 family phage protein
MVTTISPSFKWYGDEQKKRILNATEKGMLKCGLRIERDAKQLCVVDTGRLRASVSTNWTGSGLNRGETDSQAKVEDGVTSPDEKEFTVKIGTNVEYANFIEHGTSKMDPRPFLFPAYEMNIHKLPEFIKGEMPGASVIPSGTQKEGEF